MHNSKKHIVLFIDSLVSGGAQRQIILLANQLVLRGCRAKLVVYHDIMDLQGDLSSNVELCVLEKKGRLGNLKLFFSLCMLLLRERPNALISYLYIPNLLARLAGKIASVPNIICSQRSCHIDHGKLLQWLDSITVRLGSKLVVNSCENKNVLIQSGRYKGIDISVIYNGIDAQEFSKKSLDIRNSIRSEFSLGNDFLFIYPARVVYEKNHDCIVEAVARLRNESLEFKVLFVGHVLDDSVYQNLKRKINDYGISQHFIWSDQREDMSSLYAASDVLLLSSWWEGLPNIVIEAMACELPVIASDIADNKILLEGGVGEVFLPDQPGDLASLMRNFVCYSNDQRASMGVDSRERILELCDLEIFANKYLTLLGV